MSTAKDSRRDDRLGKVGPALLFGGVFANGTFLFVIKVLDGDDESSWIICIPGDLDLGLMSIDSIPNDEFGGTGGGAFTVNGHEVVLLLEFVADDMAGPGVM